MNKKLIAVAVAGALAVPGVALAQSSVTISGILKISFDNVKIGDFNNTNPNTGKAGRSATDPGNSSEQRVADDSSRIIFGVKEDLGGGLAAIGQVDMRSTLDNGGLSAAGNTFVGLQSNTMGSLTIGRHDLHYYNRESELTAKAGSLKADSISILAFAGGGGTAIANATRTPNDIKWTSPNWGGFTMIAAYSTNADGAAENDIGVVASKGSAWNLNPNFKGSNFQIGYSYWKDKGDAISTPAGVALFSTQPTTISPANCVATGAGTSVVCSTAASTVQNEQRGDRFYASYDIAGFKFGVAYDKSTITDKTGSTGAPAGTKVSDREAWSIPIQYVTGPHNIYFHYDEAKKDKGFAFSDVSKNPTGAGSGAKMFAVAYVYDLSKRSSVGITYAQIKNDPLATYNFFTTTSGIGSADAAVKPGEDPSLWALTVAHKF
jgi:predicted porin